MVLVILQATDTLNFYFFFVEGLLGWVGGEGKRTLAL